MTEWFGELEEFYPGTNRKIQHTRPVKEDHGLDLEDLTGSPRVYTMPNGRDVDFFTVGQLAIALNRKAVTIRKWEADGIIPVAQYTAPSDDPRGRRRLYTRAQVEGMVEIADSEGILHETWKPINKTDFTKRVVELFQTLGVAG